MNSDQIRKLLGEKHGVFTTIDYLDFEFQARFLDKKASAFLFWELFKRLGRVGCCRRISKRRLKGQVGNTKGLLGLNVEPFF